MKSKILVMDTATSITCPWKKELGSRFEVVEVIGGFEAISRLKSDSYNLIIVNISTVHLNGIDAVRKIRDRFKTLPIIVLYDVKDTLNLKQARMYGIQSALPLPVTSEIIINSVSRFVTPSDEKSPPENTGEPFLTTASVGETKKKADLVDIEVKFYEGLSAMAANQIDKAINIYKSLLGLTNIKKERWLKYIEESMFQLGQCYARLSDFTQSNKFYNDFISKAPYHNCVKEAFLYLGMNHEAMKDYQKASSYYRKVINMRPFDSFSTQARKLLKKIAQPE